MKTKAKGWWLLAVLVLAVTACGEESTGPDAVDLDPVPAFGKPTGRPGAGKPSGDISLEVEFDDGPTYGIRSDGGGLYHDGEELVSARIRDIGQFYFQVFDGKKKDDPVRGVKVELGAPLTGADYQEPSVADLEDFAAEVGFAGDVLSAWPAFTSDVTVHTRNPEGGMYTMGAGTTLVDGGKIGFNDFGEDSWEWRLLFDARVDGVANNVGLCVTRLEDVEVETWTVTTDGTGCEPVGGFEVDHITELWRVQRGVFTHVADFNTPMHLTLKQR